MGEKTFEDMMIEKILTTQELYEGLSEEEKRQCIDDCNANSCDTYGQNKRYNQFHLDH